MLCAHFPLNLTFWATQLAASYEFADIPKFKKALAMRDLSALVPTSNSTWLLAGTGVTLLAFAFSAFACDQLGYKIISPFLAAGAWLSAAFGVLVWLWR